MRGLLKLQYFVFERDCDGFYVGISYIILAGRHALALLCGKACHLGIFRGYLAAKTQRDSGSRRWNRSRHPMAAENCTLIE